ncbi:MAG TPA: VWA domain-containing protein [Ktedonobacteraceae bacterium]|nr:VWA domain-containing protein [Ktedonobacteraceae bacterium]
MFTITAYNNPYLRIGQNSMQAVLSITVDADADLAPAPLALGIALDRSASMDGEKISAARDGAIKVVQALDETMVFMVVTFNNEARILFGPASGTPENKRRAVQALQMTYASGGTRMSTALNTIVDQLGQDPGRATKILFLTDGKNEGEKRVVLNQAVARCAAANISINAWGVGTDWDAEELRYIANATRGNADIIPTPQQVAAAFTASFSEMRKTAVTNTRLALWSPVGVAIKQIQQVYPNITPLELQLDSANPRQRIVALGSFAAGEQHDYLCDLEIPVYQPGQQFLMLRPSMRYVTAGTGEQEEKSARTGWVFAEWTQDNNLASQIEPHIAHYTNQEELSQRINEGQAALAAGDRERATRLLGEALEISERTGNERMTRLLNTIVLRDAKGTIRLNQQADAVAKKTLAINVGRTSKLK